MAWYKTVTEFSFEDEKGKIKKTKVSALVEAETPTEAEAKTYKNAETKGYDDFKVVSSGITNFVDVIY